MKKGFLKLGFVMQNAILIFVFLFSSLAFFPIQARAVEVQLPGCPTSWTIKTPKGSIIKNSFVIDKDNLSGYQGILNSVGTNCNSHYGYYGSYGVPKTGDGSTVWITQPKPEDCQRLLVLGDNPLPIGFDGTQSYKAITLGIYISDSLEGCQNQDNTTKGLEIVAKWPTNTTGNPSDPKDPKDPAPTGGNPSTITCQISDGKGGTKTVPLDPKTGKCPVGTLACVKPDGTTVSPAADGTCPQSQSTGVLFNPIQSDSLIHLAFSLLRAFLGGVAGLAIVFIVLGGFRLVVSRGNPEAVTRGKDIIIWSLLGLVVALMAFSLTAVVQNLLGAF